MSIDTTTHSVDDCELNRVLDRVEAAVYALDEAWRFTFVNERAAAMLDREPDELLGRKIWDAVSEIAETTVEERLREAMATQTPTRFERRDEAAERWLETRVYPGEDGVTVHVSDVTEAHADQLDARRRRQLVEAAFDETDDAMIAFDADRRILDFNRAAERLFGYEADTVIGEEPGLLYADEADADREHPDRSVDRTDAHEATRSVEYERADGTTFEGDRHETALTGPDGDSIGCLTTVSDVTSHVRYERAIAAHNDALRRFHEIATDDARPVDDRIDAVLELGSEHLGTDTSVFFRVGEDACTVEHAHAPNETIRPDDEFALNETFCEAVVDTGDLVAVSDAGMDEAASGSARTARDVDAYIGAPVVGGGERHGTITFSQAAPRSRPFSAGERIFVRILGQWIGQELSRRENERRATENRARLRQIIDLLPQFVFVKDEYNEYLLANEALAEAYGTTVDDIEGSTDADCVESDAEAEAFRRDDLAVIDSGEPTEIPAETLTVASGETLTLRTVKIPYDPVGRDAEAVLGVATDITEATQRERDLERAKTRLNAALKGTNAGVWELNTETNEMVWTESMRQLLGLTDGKTERTREDFLSLVHPDDVDAVRKSFETIADGDTFQPEFRVERDDEGYIWLEARVEPASDDESTPRLVGTVVDVTERKQRTAKVELQSAAMEVATGGIAILDDGEYLYMNQAHADIFDYDPGELVGRSWRDVYTESERERIEEEVLPEVNEHGTWTGETVGRKRDGTPVHQEVGLAQLDTGELICTNKDITAQKQREAKLRRQRSQLRVLFDNSPDSITVHDAEGSVIEMNDTQLEALGYERGEIDSLNVTDFEVGVGLSELQSKWADMSTDEVIKAESTHRRRNGDTFPVEVWVSKTRNDEREQFIAVSRDITERKQRTQELNRSREFLEKTQESAAVGGWEFDLESQSLRWTDEVYRIHDLPLDATVTLEEGIDFYHPEDRSEIRSVFERLQTEGEPYDRTLRIVTAEDRVRWVRAIGDPKFDADGNVAGAVGVFQDVTDQKRLEQSLRANEQMLRELTSVASDTDLEFDEKITALLELGVERLGLPYGFLNRITDGTQHTVQAVGDHPELQPGSTAPESEGYCQKTITKDEPLTIQNAVEEGWEGHPAYERFNLGCYIGGTITVDGEPYGTVCFADSRKRQHTFDDAERAFVKLLAQWISHELTTRSFEEKLREINEAARELMTVPTNSEIASVTVDSAQTILDMPVAGVWYHDEETDTLAAECMTDEASEHIDQQPDFERGEALAWTAFTTGASQVYDDLRGHPGLYNDETVLRSEVIIPIGDWGVLLAGSVEQRAFSETDVSLLEVLSSTVEAALARAERETVLRRTQDDLKRSNEELEQFAYAASHDLQEPLRTISSYLTLLERRYGDDLDEEAGEFIEFAVDGAERMRNIIQALLAYSRVDTHGRSFEAVNVSTLFDRVVDDLAFKISETDASVSLPATDAAVSGDQSQLAQLFQNLIENAIKYNTSDPEIDIAVTPRENAVVFEVTDNGIGMEADQTDDIFEVFQRLHTRDEFAGTGIGLSICRKIVDRHGGSIDVTSTPGDGSTFTITLPAHQETDE
ncbi:PAS domain S-box protein [Halorubrum ezzemoulense]|uniref:PAS domain S-box protein n=1 Tax=Halorubrum ezzemoulense TaxID=337243 RepID=UPI00232EC948|nr:PAS domain S-box protein [Halorubrum ezzemoulense]MDB2283244.1 PAS domain S-box protein [Halorubrum ezzemoulense]